MNKIRLGLTAALLLRSFVAFAGENPNEILKKSEEIRRNKNVIAEVKLATEGPGLSDEKTFTFYRKLAEDGERFKTLTRFRTPLTIKNQSILFLEKENYENSIFMYLPTFKKVRRVESHSQSGSFMGSAFSYSDISTPLQKDYKNTYLRLDTCPLDQASKCHVIESIPKSDDVKERTGYAKQNSWIRTVDFLPERLELFQDAGGGARKIMLLSKCLKTTGGMWFCQDLKIEDFKNKKKTHLEFSKVVTDKEISQSEFTQQSMSNER